MKKLIAAVCCGAVAASTRGAGPKPIAIYPGFYTGNTYRHLAVPSRQHYVAGVIDGLLAAGLMAGQSLPSKTDLRLANCLGREPMTDEQVTAIVDQFLTNNPEVWEQSMPFLVLNAMLKACADLGMSK
ncbi:hypothetical protein [Trinickia acidisoli]|uniref:hypothetical protein n=1 Tax=Trinickia acidisoli TaxID=2767482 RepID=UPI001A8D6964|nr:hypothetical protein [Trinickia acidisoli]